MIGSESEIEVKEVKFEKDYSKVNLGIVTITRKAFKDGRSLGPSAGVYVIVEVSPRTIERATEIATEFEADWKGAIAKYNASVSID